ncbi:MAG: DNA primase [Flavobacterium sp.]|nr:MAG: DNA primase [Flavobacterium sp.]
MNTIDAVKGREWEVLAHYGIKQQGKNHQNCPICERRKKFRLNEYNSTVMYICVCGSGDIFKLLMQTTGLEFKYLANEIDQIIGNAGNYQAPIVPRRDYEKELFTFWKTLSSIKKTSVERYLQSRGIYRLPARAMKVSGDDAKSIMYCVATNDAGNPVITHQTYLEGDSKAQIEVPKRTSKVDKERDTVIEESIAVRLFNVQTCLGISEGIETALAAHQLYECVVWATMNSNFMKKFRAPGGVEHLIVFADSDKNGTGHAAAFACAHSNIMAQNDVKKVTVRWPDLGDFNDVLQETQKIHEWVLTK